MKAMRGAVFAVLPAVLPAVLLAAGALGLAGVGCGGGSAKPDGGGAGAGGQAGVGSAGRDGGAGTSAPADAMIDQATDFGGPTPDGVARCPTAAGALSAAAAELVIDDFDGTGRLDGRLRANGVFTVKEQFDATASATFDPAPAIEAACGAAAPGAAHIRGRAADTGATFAMVFSTPVAGGKAADHYDASATRGVSFRVARGDATASALLTLQVNLAGSQWDYSKDVTVVGTAWQTVTILWSDLTAAPNAAPFSAAALNQLVFPLSPGADVDLYIDDVAFVK